jgi:ABC-type multidrug transport system ATPase subunit
MMLFDKYIEETTEAEHGKVQRSVTVRDSARMLLICSQINEELTQQQKINLLFSLFAVIMADGQFTPVEYEFMTTAADIFNISTKEFNSIEQFALNQKLDEYDSPDFLIISSHKKIEYKHTKHILIETGMNGYIAVMRIAELEMYLIKYYGNETYYVNNIALKSDQILQLDSGSVIRGAKVRPIYHSDIVSKFLSDSLGPRIVYEAKEISFKFPNGRMGLHPFSFAEKSGTLVGIMGPSGAGKSTLLEILNSNKKPSTGEITINGINIHTQKSQIEGLIGYVPQDDLLIEELTVFENLYFAAKLCFGDYSEQELKELVDKTLINLGISHVSHLKVGNPLEKTISGGERKRVNIGLELLREPSVMFTDEPTSGLSSSDSLNIIDLLKELTLKGKLIFVVIHQPSSDIFKMFDKMIILDTGGYPVYYGNPIEAVMYFKSRVNHINSGQVVCSECGNINPEEIFDIMEYKTVNEYGRFTNQRKITPQNWYDYYKEYVSKPTFQQKHEPISANLNKASRFKQILIFTARDFKAKINNKQYLAINLIQAPFLAFILAYIGRYHQPTKEYTLGDNENLPVFLFMSIIVAMFLGLTVSAEEIFHDRKILKREAFLNLSRFSYLLSKTVILFVLSALQSVLFVAVSNWVLKIDGLSFNYWLVLFTCACHANMLGLNISSTFNSAITIYILIPILLIPQLILGGIVIDYDKMNPKLVSENKVPLLSEFMASRWAYEALLVTQFRDNKYESLFFDINREISNASYKTVYLLDKLKNKAEFCVNNLNSTDAETRLQLLKNKVLLMNHVIEESQFPQNPKFKYLAELQQNNWNEKIIKELAIYLDDLKSHYNYINIKKKGLLDDRRREFTQQIGGPLVFTQFREHYENQSVANVVRRKNDENRIIEGTYRMLQKLDPIYLKPVPDHYLDFRAHFFAAEKYFAGKYYNTVYFNVIFIWTLSGLLGLAVYFDAMTKFGIVVSKLTRFGKKNKS